jgi:hypothetical protein
MEFINLNNIDIIRTVLLVAAIIAGVVMVWYTWEVLRPAKDNTDSTLENSVLEGVKDVLDVNSDGKIDFADATAVAVKVKAKVKRKSAKTVAKKTSGRKKKATPKVAE